MPPFVIISGIVNGIDVTDWDPATDKHIPFHYSLDDISGKVEVMFVFFSTFSFVTNVPYIVFFRLCVKLICKGSWVCP